ncbi:response regulator transcription factor [Paraburkholderia steynii]|uniref:response regulator transcription factor n=1 Tax=Paraburkholderia steynii TaxID=1245441 RepID=UPI000B8A33BC|nr:helix-turn-helix transcriptional regulator [Paraburkholderia steynii]
MPESTLTPREREILDLLRQGISNKAIAARFGISVDTVRRHCSRIKRKCDAPSASAVILRRIPDPQRYSLELTEAAALLSAAELRVMQLLCEGLTSKQIGRTLMISHRTVDKHRENLFRKLGCRSTREVTAWLARQYANSGIPVSSDES